MSLHVTYDDNEINESAENENLPFFVGRNLGGKQSFDCPSTNGHVIKTRQKFVNLEKMAANSNPVVHSVKPDLLALKPGKVTHMRAHFSSINNSEITFPREFDFKETRNKIKSLLHSHSDESLPRNGMVQQLVRNLECNIRTPVLEGNPHDMCINRSHACDNESTETTDDLEIRQYNCLCEGKKTQ
ncbi:uncharacterized protein LOC119689916 [Teleopsis dalmanni]|uniref:uncharacterized protein LOC119689663 n=1 Tax=Teleopsis dalmanni TaxID=139649 RepID=UPI0018CD6F76|nr:uncharacterized protein LOC119689663 [Teleopsis dalmanni]XP_037960778.1 uncharacterized protein LOC119689916 [Teleopsis dalmanni]